jgi:hypothetical protein
MTATRQTQPQHEPDVSEGERLQTPDPLELLEDLRRENGQLQNALTSRIVIEQAKGMLAERLGVGVDEAFERLRHEARNRSIKLHAFAAAVLAREAWTRHIFRAPGSEPTRAVESAVGASSATTACRSTP